jgi:hypothetical protein
MRIKRTVLGSGLRNSKSRKLLREEILPSNSPELDRINIADLLHSLGNSTDPKDFLLDRIIYERSSGETVVFERYRDETDDQLDQMRDWVEQLGEMLTEVGPEEIGVWHEKLKELMDDEPEGDDPPVEYQEY